MRFALFHMNAHTVVIITLKSISKLVLLNAAIISPAMGPSSPPEIWPMTRGPTPSPATSPRYHGTDIFAMQSAL